LNTFHNEKISDIKFVHFAKKFQGLVTHLTFGRAKIAIMPVEALLVLFISFSANTMQHYY